MTHIAEPTLNMIKSGNERFISGKSNKSSKDSLQKLKDSAKITQTPKAIVLCCSDSRAPVEFIFDQDIGDLFVIRVAGNIVAPSIVGSVEFAASTFNTPLVVVMGHTHCGAIQATLDHIMNSEIAPSENIHAIVSRIKPHIYPIALMKTLSNDEKMALGVETNVLASANQLSHASRLIESLVAEGKLMIVASVLDLDTGKVKFI